MAGTQNTISSLVAQFLRLQKNSLEIMNGLNQVAVSTNNTVSIEVLDEQGLPKTANIPSYGFLRGEIDRLDTNIKSLAGIGDYSSTVRNPDGTYSQVFKVETLKNPPSLSNLAVPSTFSVKDNWFFESFLSPLLYISINVTGQISDGADRIVVKRVIANTQTDDQKAYFDAHIKGRNDLTYDQYLKILSDNGIGYFVDEDIIQLPLRTIRYIGNFGVISYYDDNVTTVDQNGNSFQETRRNYKLDKITYTDTSTEVKDGKSLNVNDQIATQDGSLYKITSVNRDQASIQAKRVSGYQPIQIGANSISISSTDFGPRYVQVNVGYNERQGIFFKTIDDNFNIVSANWSTGIVFWSNELKTKNSKGEVVNLETYYLNEVSDLGKVFLGAAKENKIPAIQGLRPDAPLVTVDSFKVVQINKQVTDSTSVKVVEDKLNLKTTLKSEIDALDQAIAETRLELNAGLSRHVTNTRSPRFFTSDYTQYGEGYDNGINVPNRNYDNIITNSNITSPPGTDVKSIRANLNSLIDERTKKSQLYASLVDEVNVLVKDVPQIVEAPKYRVRGFWPFPAPKIDPTTGPQEVIQFNVKYRYLSNGGASQPAEQIEFVDNDGAKKNATFSNWTEYKTDIRKKNFDDAKGIYVWSGEVTSNANVQNVNQLDIAITKGERVEIQISSVSEAGWPENPLVSDYSASVIIQFPDSLSVVGVADTLNANVQDAALVKMQRTLDSQGLPSHLSQQFTAGNNTFYHDTSGIASGFFTSSGTVISLFDKITDLQNQITLLTSQLSKAKGVLEVYVLDSNNNKIKVSKGSTVKITAGFYADIFSDPLGFDAGKTASFTYNLQLFNQQASSVELASIIPGGLSQRAPSSISASFPVGYNDNLRYGDCPISVTSLTLADPSIINNASFRQAPPFASSNAYSQYIYPRFKTVGYDQPLYQSDPTISAYFTSATDDGVYTGKSATNFNISKNGTSATYPQSGTSMIPYDPSAAAPPESGPTNSSIWNGTYSGTTGGTPNSGGYLTEFCIHKDHPYLISVGNTNSYNGYVNMVKPFVSGGKVYPPFRHTQTFWGDTSLNYYWIQQAYRVPTTFTQVSSDPRTDAMYSDKLGFTVNDQYLIGKYSCGAYLYLAPQAASALQVSGTTSLSTLSLGTGETNAINVPIIFQFRAVDKLGYIGGWRKSGNLSNVTYTKKIGVDLQVLNSDSFTFDIQVTGSYKNDTLVAPNFDSGLSTN